MFPMLTLIVSFSAVGQAPPANKPDEADVRLTIMKDSLADHPLNAPDEPKRTFRLKAEPAMRFNNAVGAVSDGAIFFWVDENERPAAAAQVFKSRDGNWEQAFTSLSAMPLALGSIWAPASPGVVFKPVASAPKPAENAAQRLRQMRDLAKGFSAEMKLEFKTWHTLRLLPAPLSRYGKAGSGVLDGGVFSFVLTTDPEVFLLLEAREGKDGPEWRYALAPEASAPIRCSWKGSNVWEFAADGRMFSSREPYFVRGFAPTGGR